MPFALKLVLALSALAFCGFVGLVALSVSFTRSMVANLEDLSRDFPERTVEMPFIGPDPWKPDSSPATRSTASYSIPAIGMSLELPSSPRRVDDEFTESDAREISGYFGYEQADGDVEFLLYGTRMKDPANHTAEVAAEWFEWMYEGDPAFEDVRFDRKPISWGGIPAFRITGSFRHGRERVAFDGLAAAHEGLHVGILVQHDSARSAARQLDAIARTTRFAEPKPKAKATP